MPKGKPPGIGKLGIIIPYLHVNFICQIIFIVDVSDIFKKLWLKKKKKRCIKIQSDIDIFVKIRPDFCYNLFV